MSIINVKESWERTAGITETERNTDRIYTVYFDEADNPLIRPLLALNATSPDCSIPQYGERHPADSGLFMTKKTSEATGPLVYKVTCSYSSIQVSSKKGEGATENPLLQRPKIRWIFAVSNEPIDRDIYGKAITNTAKESFDPPMTEEQNDLVLQYVRNERKYDPLQAWKYKGAVSNDNFLGFFPPGITKCTNYEAEPVYDDKWGDYFVVSYEFQFRYNEIDGEQIGWKRRRLNEGFRKYLGTDVETGEPVYWNIKDKDGEKISQPALLNIAGVTLADGAKPVFLEFETLRKLPFSVLKIKL